MKPPSPGPVEAINNLPGEYIFGAAPPNPGCFSYYHLQLQIHESLDRPWLIYALRMDRTDNVRYMQVSWQSGGWISCCAAARYTRCHFSLAHQPVERRAHCA